MAFKRLSFRYQTARSLPAPYAYFCTLAAQPVAHNALQIDLTMTYPDRDDIDEDELIAEGFSRDDDFNWSGQLSRAWLDSLTHLADKTRLRLFTEDDLGEDDDFWDLTISADKDSRQGRPDNTDDWQYLLQELVQALYELMGRERPFTLTYLQLDEQQEEHEVRLTASFAERTVNVIISRNRRERTQTLSWTALQRIMSKVYEHDFDPEDAQLKRPRLDSPRLDPPAGDYPAGDKIWLNLGGEEWYDIHQIRTLTKLFNEL